MHRIFFYFVHQFKDTRENVSNQLLLPKTWGHHFQNTEILNKLDYPLMIVNLPMS